MANRKTNKTQTWNVFSAQQGVDMGSPNDVRLLGVVNGTRDQVVAYALRTWPNFKEPWGGRGYGKVELAVDPVVHDATKESPYGYLSLESQKVLNDFDDAARRWGWSSDQGSRSLSEHDEYEYDQARKALVLRIIELEKAAK